MAKKRRLAMEVECWRRAARPAPIGLRPEQLAVVRAVAGTLRRLADLLTELVRSLEER